MKRCYLIIEKTNYITPGKGIESFETQISTTYAASEKQAVNNFCYRTGRKRYECDYGYADNDVERILYARPYTLKDMERERK